MATTQFSDASENSTLALSDYHLDAFLYSYLCIKIVLSLMGIISNPLAIGAVVMHGQVLAPQSAYIVSLGIADFIVNFFVDGSTIIAIIRSATFFEERQSACTAIGVFCLTACVASLWTMTGIAINRYFYICKRSGYDGIYTKKKTVASLAFIWIGSFMVGLPLLLGWGRYGIDQKSLVCTYDRTSSYSYTLFFFVVGIVTPICMVLVAYTCIYLYVRNHKRRIQAISAQVAPANNNKEVTPILGSRDIQLLKTFFTIFLLFVICWGSYGFTVVADYYDAAPREWHSFSVVLAHTNSSVNGILYGVMNKRFRKSYKKILNSLFCLYGRNNVTDAGLILVNTQSHTTHTVQ